MNQEILALTLRIAADITMSQTLKDDLIERLSIPLKEADILSLTEALDVYQAGTRPIINRALSRLDDTRLMEIESISTKLVADINTDVESYVGQTEKQDAETILSSI